MFVWVFEAFQEVGIYEKNEQKQLGKSIVCGGGKAKEEDELLIIGRLNAWAQEDKLLYIEMF